MLHETRSGSGSRPWPEPVPRTGSEEMQNTLMGPSDNETRSTNLWENPPISNW
jgi:hypothetical protein